MFSWWRGIDWRYRTGGVAGVIVLTAALLYGRLGLARTEGPVRLQVYAFSTQEEVLTQVIFPEFEKVWEEETGRKLTIDGIFGASATLAGQINLGAPADVAIFSNAQHVTYLRIGRRVRAGTAAVLVGKTPMVIVTRAGNPDGIGAYADLAKPGVDLLHADPRYSGAGQWAVLAEYGSALIETGDAAAAEGQLVGVWRNVHRLASSARSAMTLFELGTGNAMVTYEQAALCAQQRGVQIDIVVPAHTVIAEHVAVVVDDNVTLVERPAAEAFVAYLQTDEAQQAFVCHNVRPADNRQHEAFPTLEAPFVVDALGGWADAYAEVIEKIWIARIEPTLNLEPAAGPVGVEE